MRPFLDWTFGNASSLHRAGQEARAALERARSVCAGVLGCEPGEIVFTSGGTESNNLALRGLAWAAKDRGDVLLCSAIEHPSVRETVGLLGQQGFAPKFFVPQRNGLVDPAAIEALVGKGVTLLALMYANNETGVVQPMAAVGRMCRSRKIAFHVDAVQAPGRLPLAVDELQCDTLSISAHKFEGPKGVGLLYVRRGTLLQGHMSGGPQEAGRRGGTQNVAGIVGMAEALRWAESERAEESVRLAGLRERFEQELKKRAPGVVVLGGDEHVERLVNTSFVAFPGVPAEQFVIAMDLEDVAVSTGAACSEGAVISSHVLEAMQAPEALIKSAVRFSLGRATTDRQLDRVLGLIPMVIERLRENEPQRS